MVDLGKKHAPILCLPAPPIIGNIFALRYHRLNLLTRISQRFGDIGAFHFGPSVVPLLNSPDLVREALVEQHTAFAKTATVRKLASPVIGNGIFLSEGELHRRHRRLIAPLFQHQHALSYTEMILAATSQARERWQEDELINLGDEMASLTLRIISMVLFGIELSNVAGELGEALICIFRHFASAMTNPLRPPQSWPTPHNLQVKSALASVNTTIYRLLDECRASHEPRQDFLSLLLRSRDDEQVLALSDREIRNEALSLFVAGHETTATALTWCWYLLSQHPTIYARLLAEVDQVLQGRPPTSADLANLPYTLQVFQETLRLYPPLYAFTRRAVIPVQVGSHRIPQGASIVISPYTLHRRPEFFPDPERFDPDRFAPSNKQAIPRYAYLPFSAGPRICPGMPFALLEGQLILATLAQYLTFEYAGPTPLQAEPLLTLRPRGEVLMRIRRRQQLSV